MPEWSTYELANFLLFSPRTYERMLESHNAAMWPAGHALAILSGIALVVLSARRGPRASLASGLLLALACFWVAWAFHLERYAPINWAAGWFALAFAIQGAMLVMTEAFARSDTRATMRFTRVAGLVMTAFGIFALPLVERLLGRPWTQVEIFALFPDATALATLGLLLARERLDWHLFPIPLLWCFVGAGTLAAMGKPDAPVIAGTAVAAAVLLAWKVVARRGAPDSVAGRDTAA
jgi:hypothetical protein